MTLSIDKIDYNYKYIEHVIVEHDLIHDFNLKISKLPLMNSSKEIANLGIIIFLLQKKRNIVYLTIKPDNIYLFIVE